MKQLIGASLLVLAGLQSGYAADLPRTETYFESPVAVATPVKEQKIWEGAYIGALIGYGWAQFDTSKGVNPDPNGIQGGIYGGYNFQIDQYVFGIESDFVLTDFDETSHGLKAESDWTSTLRVRAGVALPNEILVYATGGLALTDAELSHGAVSQDEILYGYTIGAGVETYLTKNVTFRAEYLYTDFEDETFNLSSGTSAEFDNHTLRVGVGYKF